jgi:hypothetical protein
MALSVSQRFMEDGAEFLALASNKVPGKQEKPHGADKERANCGLRFLLFGSEVGLCLPGA